MLNTVQATCVVSCLVVHAFVVVDHYDRNLHSNNERGEPRH